MKKWREIETIQHAEAKQLLLFYTKTLILPPILL